MRGAAFGSAAKLDLGRRERSPHASNQAQDLALQLVIRQRPESTQQLELCPHELALVTIAGGGGVQTLEEELEGLAEESRGLQQPARADANLAPLVFLHGLERHTKRLRHLNLAQTEEATRQPEARADMDVRGIGPMFLDRAPTASGASPFLRCGACLHVQSPGRNKKAAGSGLFCPTIVCTAQLRKRIPWRRTVKSIIRHPLLIVQLRILASPGGIAD